jgi:hypothetical protein
MYGLAQCMRDRTAKEYGHQGKVVLGYNCYLRVEVYTYYDLALDARQPPLLPPAPAPSPTPSFVPITGGEGKREFSQSCLLFSLNTILLSSLNIYRL